MDGWVSLEVSSLLAGRPPEFVIKIPGTAAGLVAIEECMAAGVPIHVAELAAGGVDVGVLAVRLQDEGVEGFVASWKDLLQHLDAQVKS